MKRGWQRKQRVEGVGHRKMQLSAELCCPFTSTISLKRRTRTRRAACQRDRERQQEGEREGEVDVHERVQSKLELLLGEPKLLFAK